MAVVVVGEGKGGVVDFGGELEGVGEGEGGGGEKGGRAVGGVGVGEGLGAGGIGEAGDVLVAVVEIVEGGVGGVAEEEGAGGNGLGGVPDVGLIGGVVEAAELLDTLKEVGSGRGGAHFHAASHAVECHRDDGVAGLPTHGAVLGVVGHLPDAGRGLDEGLVAIGVVLGHEAFGGAHGINFAGVVSSCCHLDVLKDDERRYLSGHSFATRLSWTRSSIFKSFRLIEVSWPFSVT